MRFTRRPLAWLACGVLLLTPSVASSQWHGAVFLGAAHTQSADVMIDQPQIGRSVRVQKVDFEARSFRSPQYYGWRLGRMFGLNQIYGVELEFIHLKQIALTDRDYVMAGTGPGVVNGTVRMNTVVDRYQMTHGLNFVLVNVVSRLRMRSGPATLVFRSGVGQTRPHAETTIAGESIEQYEWAGLGSQASAGVDVKVTRLLSATAEYKLTYARPRITVVGGTGTTTSVSHHLAFGISVGHPR